jgi:hypothetical protein
VSAVAVVVVVTSVVCAESSVDCKSSLTNGINMSKVKFKFKFLGVSRQA